MKMYFLYNLIHIFLSFLCSFYLFLMANSAKRLYNFHKRIIMCLLEKYEHCLGICPKIGFCKQGGERKNVQQRKN